MRPSTAPLPIPPGLASPLSDFLNYELHSPGRLTELLAGSSEQKVGEALALARALSPTLLEHMLASTSANDLAFLTYLTAEDFDQLRQLADLLGYERMQNFFARRVYLLRHSVHVRLSA